MSETPQKPQPPSEMVANMLMSRAGMLQQMQGTSRDIDAECGYPKVLSPAEYKALYDREGIAARVVSVFPDESWVSDPIVYETEEAEETEFEKAWNTITNTFNVYHYLARVDELSGIGRYGVLLLGVSDGGALNEPVARVEVATESDSEGSGADLELLYLRAFPESCVSIDSYETDTSNSRYGQPKLYSITFTEEGATAAISKKVHWTRIIHVADNRKSSDVFGIPRMQRTFNRLYDLRKVLSGSGEMFWKGAFPGYAFEVNPNLEDVELDGDAMKEEFERYSNGLQRYLALTGVSAKSLAPQVADPGPHMMAHLKAICISEAIPWRIFLGSEEAKLASNQDSKAWNKRLGRRRDKYLSPMLIRPLIDRFMLMGVIPTVEDYKVKWTDLEAASDQEKADVADKVTASLAKYVAGRVDNLIPPLEFFTMVLGLDADQASEIIKAAQKYHASNDPDILEDEAEDEAEDDADDADGDADVIDEEDSE